MALNRLLKQIREQRHFDLEDVAKATKIRAARLVAFEEGEREPSFKQLSRLADTYGLAPYVLANRSLPNLQDALPDFRRTNPTPARLSPAGARKIWNSESIAAFSAQLIRAIEFKPPAWASSLPSGQITQKHAIELRAFFDEWLRPRRERLEFAGTDEQKFFGAFRLFLEVQGLVVNVNDAPATDFLGFYTNAIAAAPVAFVNRTISSKRAQLFTAVHEYAHHLIGASGVSNPFLLRNSVERTCNKFAAEFLAPMNTFRELAEAQPRAVRSNIFALINTISSRSLLSKHAAGIRLVEAGYLTQAQLKTWEDAVKGTPKAEKDDETDAAGESFGQPHAKRISELGYLPTFLAKIGVDRKIIDKVDVQAGLALSETLQARAFSLVQRRFDIAVNE